MKLIIFSLSTLRIFSSVPIQLQQTLQNGNLQCVSRLRMALPTEWPIGQGHLVLKYCKSFKVLLVFARGETCKGMHISKGEIQSAQVCELDIAEK